MRKTLLALIVGASLLELGALAQTPRHSFAITTGDGPVITDPDVIEYRFAEHALRIRGESLMRVARMRPGFWDALSRYGRR